MNLEILREFGADLSLRDSENAGPTSAEIRMADEIHSLRAEIRGRGLRDENDRLRAECYRLSAHLSLSNRRQDHLGMSLRDVIAERDALRAENHRLRVDAERYQWLICDEEWLPRRFNSVWRQWNGEGGSAGFTAALDAAMNEGKR